MSKLTNTASTTTTLSHQRLRFLTLTALFAAMITIMTAYIAHIPVANGGYIHFGDSLIYLASALLPTPYALAAGAIGGGLADLLTAPVWTIATVMVKMLITIPFSSKKDTIINTHNIVAAIIAFVISGIGYFIAEILLFGMSDAAFFAAFIGSIGGSAIQSGGSMVFFILFGCFLDKIGFKKSFINS